MPVNLENLRRYAIARSLFKPSSLPQAMRKLGFVQADPIRAPARAQDLTLRHRVRDYRAGDLERRYSKLNIEEDFFVNYGFLSREHHQLLHPRNVTKGWTPTRRKQAQAVHAFIAERGEVHPREVDAQFAHGRVRNWFGGTSNASTALLDAMHYRGLLRVAHRDGGTRVYAIREAQSAPANIAATSAPIDTLIDVIVQKYAPLPAASLGQLIRYLIAGAPQWAAQKPAALARAKERLACTKLDGIDWYWPAAEMPYSRRWQIDERVRLLTPFDPIVWDRRRFELFWGWTYRFEAYTPPAKRKLGYYALPLLWHDHVVGWANVTVRNNQLISTFGYHSGTAPRDRAYSVELDQEIDRLREFLGLTE